MSQYKGLDKPRGPGYYLFWKAAFVGIVLATMAFFWYASNTVEYIWRWNNVPNYFWVDTKADIHAEISGETSVSKGPDGSVIITVHSEDGEVEDYAIPAKSDILVSDGDYIYSGDSMASYQISQPGVLLEGIWLTLKVSALAIFFGVILGLFTGLARISDNPALRWLSITYIEIIRGSPLMVQIFLWYFVMGTLINAILEKFAISAISPLWYGVMALAIFTGAYVAEIVRAGIQSVHRGQMEAARSLGMSYPQAMRKVILPQAFRRILPPLAGQFISLVKDSSLLGVISMRELTKATREAVTTSLQPFELWIVCAILYLVLTFALSLCVQYLERKAVMR